MASWKIGVAIGALLALGLLLLAGGVLFAVETGRRIADLEQQVWQISGMLGVRR